MTTFRGERRLRSLHVDRQLLSSLETWLTTQVPRMRNDVSCEDCSFSVRITDDLGTEELARIDDFLRWRNGYREPRLEVGIALDSESGPRLDVDFSGPNARDLVVAINSSFDRIVEGHYRSSDVFHFPGALGLSTFINGATLVILLLSLQKMSNGEIRADVKVSALLFPISIWFIYSHFMRPLVSFDSRKQRGRDSAWKWVGLGVLTFLIFGMLGVALRKRLFGF
jgi:hypothetical protein